MALVQVTHETRRYMHFYVDRTPAGFARAS
jgi:hypothetical protein